jgi:hypothetical protein
MPRFYTFPAARVPLPEGAKAAKATGREKLCAIAPIASGAGRRVNALNNDADDRPTAGCILVRSAAGAKLQGAIGPAPTPMRAKPAPLAANPALDRDGGGPGGGKRKGSDDDSLIAEPQPDEIRIEAKCRLADGKERRAEAGDRREPRRLRAQKQRRSERGRRLGGDRESDDDSEPDQGGGEGEAERRSRRRRVALAAGGAIIGEAGRR